jgi:hypothetical protein
VSTTPHKDLDDEVGQWARENGVPPPADEQPPASDAASDAHASDTASDAPKRDDQVDGEEDEDGLPPVDNTPMSDEEKTEAAAETAAMIVGAVDFVMTKFVGQRMALSEKEEAKFVKLATPIVRRRMPKISAPPTRTARRARTSPSPRTPTRAERTRSAASMAAAGSCCA